MKWRAECPKCGKADCALWIEFKRMLEGGETILASDSLADIELVSAGKSHRFEYVGPGLPGIPEGWT